MSFTDSLKDKLYSKPENCNFNYDALLAPPLQSLIPNYNDIMYLYNLVTDIRYRSKSQYKFDEINKVMNYNGFKKLHAGTNRLVYKHMELPDIVAKIPYRKVALEDNLQEYHNQNFIKPYCAKTFEVHPSGIIAISERVVPLTHRDELYNVKELIMMMLSSLLANGLVFDDLGAKFFRNYGYRKNFGPVFIDYPTIYEVDSRKLYCKKQYINSTTPCGGELTYDDGLNHLVCKKCGIEYSGRDVGIPLFKAVENHGIIMFDKEDKKMRVTFYRDNKVESEVIAASNTINSPILDEALSKSMKVSLSREEDNVEQKSSTVKSVEDISSGNDIEVNQVSETEFEVISETKTIPEVINLKGYGLYKLIKDDDKGEETDMVKDEILTKDSIEEPVELNESDFPTEEDFDETGRFILETVEEDNDERDV